MLRSLRSLTGRLTLIYLGALAALLIALNVFILWSVEQFLIGEESEALYVRMRGAVQQITGAFESTDDLISGGGLATRTLEPFPAPGPAGPPFAPSSSGKPGLPQPPQSPTGAAGPRRPGYPISNPLLDAVRGTPSMVHFAVWDADGNQLARTRFAPPELPPPSLELRRDLVNNLVRYTAFPRGSERWEAPWNESYLVEWLPLSVQRNEVVLV